MAPGRAGAVAGVSVLMLLAGCGGGDGSSAASPQGADTGPLAVAASFYPLQWLSTQVGGDAVTVSSLTRPGVEPHDLELTPQDVAAVGAADLVVYLSGFQPAVDEAVAQQAAESAFDAAEAARLTLTYTPIEQGAEETSEAGTVDPHFWLDPMRLADVGAALAERLGEADPARAATFTANAEAVRAELVALDGEFTGGLASCVNRDLVTSHNAFGYLAEAYDLTQVGITGLTPEAEPSAADLSAVTDFVRANKVAVIYYETLISPDIAQTVATETGATTEVLDPLEGLNDESQGEDYLAVMRANLASLRTGQPCP